jgi:hypothetical protein
MLPSESQARKFVDYALTLDIRSKAEADGDAWAVWVYDEDRVPQAKEELGTFRENPDAEKYVEARSAADALREREIKQH